MVLGPSEANSGGRNPKYDFAEVAKKTSVENWSTGSDLDSCRSRELNRRHGRPGEGQGGPNKGHLDTNFGPKRKSHFNLVSWSSMPELVTVFLLFYYARGQKGPDLLPTWLETIPCLIFVF